MPLNLDNSGEFSEKIYLPNGNYRAEVTAYRNDEMLFATAAASFAVEAQSGPLLQSWSGRRTSRWKDLSEFVSVCR